jgi:hypothetical protein
VNNETTALLNRLPLIIALKDLHTHAIRMKPFAPPMHPCFANKHTNKEAEPTCNTAHAIGCAGSKWHTIKVQLLYHWQ